MFFLKVISFLIGFCTLISSEEPFCNNKCHNSGITTSRICYCDSLCSTVFNDCCGDSEQLLNKFGRISYNRDTMMKCTEIANSKASVMTIHGCSSDWKGPDFIRNSCTAQSNSIIDPVNGVPVTNILTGTTYSNYQCAICNGWMKTLVPWKIKVVCPTMNPNLMELEQSELLKFIFYNQTSEQWGFSIVDDISNHEVFHGCQVSYTIPRLLRSKVRYCDPQLKSTCSPGWKNDLVKRMCQRYIDPVYIDEGDIRFKNLYCAICNWIDLSRISCGQAIGPRNHGMPGREDFTENFALLLDVDINDGNTVGKKSMDNNCEKEEVYDPFFKKCRNVVCGIPGVILKDGKCTQKTRNKVSRN